MLGGDPGESRRAQQPVAGRVEPRGASMTWMICAVISDESGPAEKTAGTVSRFWLRWTSSEDVMSMVECVVVPALSLTLAVGILKKRLSSL